jgi:hypothetical protein
MTRKQIEFVAGFVAGALGAIHTFEVDVQLCEDMVDRALQHLRLQTEAFAEDALAEIRALTDGVCWQGPAGTPSESSS